MYKLVAVILVISAAVTCAPDRTAESSSTTACNGGQECTTNENKKGTCVAYYQCPSFEFVPGDDGLIDIRPEEPEDNYCPDYLDVCCVTPKVDDVKDSTHKTIEIY